MTRTIYALLVGIDKYPAPVSPLYGCVNDIRRMETLLRERVSSKTDRFSPLVLTDEKATRQNIIDGFRNHLCQAGPEDIVLFCYSGHGSQQKSPPEFWHLEPDRLDETLVCVDSRLLGGWDLADKELAQLIAEVAENDPHIVIILDSCHSGSGTRDPKREEGVTVRLTTTDQRTRSIENFIISLEDVPDLVKTADVTEDWFKLPKGKHVVLSACRDDEEAKEKSMEGEQHGVFSYFLLEALQQAETSLSYRDLFKRVNARVRNNVTKQAPQLEATDTAELDLPFLGGSVASRAPYFTLSYVADKNWWFIDGGAVHGISAGSGDQQTRLALFSHDTAPDSLHDLTVAIGEATVLQVQPSRSMVLAELSGDEILDSEKLYKAIVTAMPFEPLIVSMSGHEIGLALVRDALNCAGPDGKASLTVQEGEAQDAELRLVAEEGRYQILRAAETYSLAVDVDGFSQTSASAVVRRLEHIERWNKVANLANPTTRLPTDAIRVEFYLVRAGAPPQRIDDDSDLYLAYEQCHGEWQNPEFKVQLTNTSNRTLYCALLHLTESYSIWSGLIPGGTLRLKKGEQAWAYDGEPIPGWIEDELWENGVIEIKERLKLIVSDSEFDATLLEQDELDVEFQPSGDISTRAVGPLSTLDSLMGQVQTRGLGKRKANKLADWRTSEFILTIVRPQEPTTITSTSTTLLGSGVVLMPHPSLKAKARLDSASHATRDVGSMAMPPMLRNHPNVGPFQFSATRSAEPGLSVIELMDVEDHTVVTAEQPLIVKSKVQLDPDEHLLPVGYDGEFYLPLGRAVRQNDGTEIHLDRLPEPTSAGTRSLTGSIKIYFQKVKGTYLGGDYDYPRLAVATLDNHDEIQYTYQPEAVAAKVAEAERILLYIHGITGDTQGMAASAWTTQVEGVGIPALADRYDLILTFDYESFNTTIRQSAVDLKACLDAVGLGAGHDKTLRIVAHSMGGLISRWFVEREGGNQVVQHLVMLGTPSGGSPWSSIQDWALTVLGFGLNGLSLGVWPVHALSTLVAAIENIDVALDELNPSSEFLQALATSPDPGIPYTIISGSTSIIPAAMKADNEEQSRFSRLWSKIKPKGWLYSVADLAFFSQPNDIAVSLDSIRDVSEERTPQPEKLDEIACDHLSYFSTEVGLRALSDSLG